MNDYLQSLEWNGLLAALLYWVPLAFCAIFYTVRSAQGYMRDKAEREKPGGYYVPRETIGSLIGRAVVTVLPIANLWAALFDLSPKVFGEVFEWIGATFSQPLVPDSEGAKAARRGQGQTP